MRKRYSNETAWDIATKALALDGNPGVSEVCVCQTDIEIDGISIDEGQILPISSWSCIQADESFHPSIGVCWPGLDVEITLDLRRDEVRQAFSFFKLTQA